MEPAEEQAPSVTLRIGTRLGPSWLGILLLVGFFVVGVEAFFIRQPGYVDACYSFNAGRSLAAGSGLQDPYLWNYLDDSIGIPHPSHTYWMPLPSLLVALGTFLFSGGFRGAQIPFGLLAALLPVVTALVSMRLTGNRRVSVAAGFLMAFPSFYAIYLTDTDSVAPFAMLGALFFPVLIDAVATRRAGLLVLLGVLAGLAHLLRADGLILVGIALACAGFAWPRFEKVGVIPDPSAARLPGERWYRRLVMAGLRVGLVLVAYLAVTGFWYLRNLALFGSLMPSSGFRTLWLLRYDDFFHFPGSDLTPERFWSSGVASILQARWQALGWNLQTLFFGQGWVILFPFVALGLVHLRRLAVVRCAVLYGAILLAAMTIVFPWSGARGGYLHSGAALLPTFALAASAGLDRAVEWVGSIRRWNIPRARLGLSAVAILAAALATGISFQKTVVGSVPESPAWSHLDDDYSQAGAWLKQNTPRGTRVMVNNPPCFYYRTGLSSVVVPDGDVTTVIAVAEKYQVGYLLLDANSPSGLILVYQGLSPSGQLHEVSRIENGPQGGPLKIYRILFSP
jgi:hypothetical protein